ncbi:hypothetical protein CNR22_13830 [Sphingobacteriaceae bacterium]|nr:hypothetical protein CNR22_13830 [Sphingobacteriaceae bacterium]
MTARQLTQGPAAAGALVHAKAIIGAGAFCLAFALFIINFMLNIVTFSICEIVFIPAPSCGQIHLDKKSYI